MMTHRLRYAANCSLLFKEVPLLERPAAAMAAGFQAIELWWPWPDQPVPADADVDAFVSAVRNAGVQLIGLNFDFPFHLRRGSRRLATRDVDHVHDAVRPERPVRMGCEGRPVRRPERPPVRQQGTARPHKRRLRQGVLTR